MHITATRVSPNFAGLNILTKANVDQAYAKALGREKDSLIAQLNNVKDALERSRIQARIDELKRQIDQLSK